MPPGSISFTGAMFRATTDRRLRDRLQIILMAQRGRPHGQIADDLGVRRRTIPRWLNAYNAYLDGGLDALLPRKAKGATSKVPASLAEEISSWVEQGPAK